MFLFAIRCSLSFLVIPFSLIEPASLSTSPVTRSLGPFPNVVLARNHLNISSNNTHPHPPDDTFIISCTFLVVRELRKV